jgi:hypothetical protein
LEIFSQIPWWMFVAGGCSFVVVTAGMIAWTVFMNRMEDDADKAEQAGRGMAPPTHPEPLKAWCAAACASVDGGTSWVDEPAAKARQFLSSMWQVNDAAQAEERLRWCQSQEPNAWNLVGALRLALAAHAAQYFDAGRAWGWARPIAQALQARHPSFAAIGEQYLAARRAWKQMPPDGSGDDAEQQGYVQRFAALSAQGFRVDYRAPL